MPGQCLNAYQALESSPSETVTPIFGTPALESGGFTFKTLNSAVDHGNVVFESNLFQYKIYRLKYLSSNLSSPFLLSWIGCDMGPLTLESEMTTG